jgi:predicted nucleic acid-binding protein
MLVVDASALAAILFGEPEAEAVAARLGAVPLAAPALIELELANTCLKKCRRAPEERARLLAAFALRSRLGITSFAVPAGATVELALATGLSAYDAAYLWLARHLGAPLVTLDSRLAAASA